MERLPILKYKNDLNEEVKAVTFDEKCKAFMSVLFKKPPQSDEINIPENYIEDSKWNWQDLSYDELEDTIFSSAANKAAGPDEIFFLIIQKLYSVLKKPLFKLYKKLLSNEYHFKCWRTATDVILSKLNRKNLC